MLARAHKKFQRGQHSEIYLLTLKEQDKTKMELRLDMVSKHAFWYIYLQEIYLMSNFGFIHNSLFEITHMSSYNYLSLWQRDVEQK